jgi:hypothetical protein
MQKCKTNLKQDLNIMQDYNANNPNRMQNKMQETMKIECKTNTTLI